MEQWVTEFENYHFRLNDFAFRLTSFNQVEKMLGVHVSESIFVYDRPKNDLFVKVYHGIIINVMTIKTTKTKQSKCQFIIVRTFFSALDY